MKQHKRSAYRSHLSREEDEFTLKEKLAYGLLGVVVLGGSVLIGRNMVRQVIADKEEKKTFEQGNEATFAKQLKMAFDNDMWMGWGTDEEAIRKVMQTIPSKEVFQKVIQSYQRLYNRSLMRDLQDELTSTEYEEILSILSVKPQKGNMLQAPVLSVQQFQAWATRLKAAFTITYGIFPGTDEEAVKAVIMELPTQAAFQQLEKTYKQMYGNDLMTELRSELEVYELMPLLNLLRQKPKN